jgi:hypothetical protein
VGLQSHLPGLTPSVVAFLNSSSDNVSYKRNAFHLLVTTNPELPCVSSSFCLAVGSGSPPLAELWNGTTWALSSTSAAEDLYQPVFPGVSCTSSTSCVTMGYYFTEGGGTEEPLVETWDGSGWVVNQGPEISGYGIVDGVSCPSQGSCVGVGDGGTVGGLAVIPGTGSLGRYVALGDAVPYGHGLADPGTKGHDGLPPNQSPSPSAYPALVAEALDYTVPTRNAYCSLSGDQLSVSGAPMSSADVTGAWKDCPGHGRHPAVFPDELNAIANPSSDPPSLVTIQGGADDINFAGCLKYSLEIPGGKKCTNGPAVTATVSNELANVTSALTDLIKDIGKGTDNKTTIAVVNYYQPIPTARSFKSDGSQLCSALALHNASTYREALLIATALNNAIAKGVTNALARPTHSKVISVDISSLLGDSTAAAHGMCTAQPWLFTGSLFDGAFWRAVHPNAEGQEGIAQAVEAAISP